MNTTIHSKVGTSETLKARKAHLSGLLNLVKPRTGKTTKTETLTIAAIDAEMSLIEQQLKKRG
ncbi:hypothetical protein [Pseudomonas sp. QTF5]|uniref:hypothetical protein n=1 Tax=Pseudomonas sp. QTF5 TaxID=1435425 RepID=UPI0004BE2656|nr:hypothetical protein [Pseudomonas sp. QTF5]